ncbi:hypothetical protein ACMFCN_28410 [Klebsiella michiganensis]|uniref:hypothetical protein n=1 Tax=Klebsiella michiganensis TaxID=1134687 RepID=UPI003CEEB9ED
MTSKLTREQTQQIIDAADAVISALAGTNDEVHKDDTDKMIRLWDDLNNRYAPPEVVRELARIAQAAMDSEPVAYMTYKGYLLHAGDPKLAEYSEPTPLYADSRPAAMPAAPVAWLWSRNGDDERDVSLTPPDDDDDAADAIECGWTATPLYRHAQQPVVDIEPMQMFGIGSIFKPQVISDQEADCDDCAHYNPKICHGEGCPAISQQSPQPAPVVSEDLYKLANHIASSKNGLPDEWQDWAEELEADIRRAAMLNGGKS